MVDDLFFSSIFSLVLGLILFGIFICLATIFLLGKYDRFRSICSLFTLNTNLSALIFFALNIEICINGFQTEENLHVASCTFKRFSLIFLSMEFVSSHTIRSVIHLCNVRYHHQHLFVSRRSIVPLIIVSWLFSLVIAVLPSIVDHDGRLCLIFTNSIGWNFYLIAFLLLLPSLIIVSNYVYLYRRLRLLNSPILRMIGTDLAMRILGKKSRRELKNSFSLLIQIGIYLLGSLPNVIFFLRWNSIDERFYLLVHSAFPLSMTVMLIVSSLTDRLIRRTLIPKRRFSSMTSDASV